MQIDRFNISPIPLYNGTVQRQGFALPAEDLHTRMKTADRLLVVTRATTIGFPAS